MVRAQQLGHGGERKTAVFVLGENTLARQRAQHTVKRLFEYSAFPGHLCGCTRSISEPIGNAEFGGYRDRARD